MSLREMYFLQQREAAELNNTIDVCPSEMTNTINDGRKRQSAVRRETEETTVVGEEREREQVLLLKAFQRSLR